MIYDPAFDHDHAAADTRAQPSPPPFASSHLPPYGTLVYFEKLGVVVLTAVAVVWVLFHLIAGNPDKAVQGARRG